MIYVEDVFIEYMPKRENLKTPRERYITYQNDLHKACGESITESTMWEGDQYSYVELGNAVLSKPEAKKKLSSTNLTIFSCWTPEFDPDYSAFGPYFMHEYGLEGDSFDICDCGSIPDFISIDIAHNFLISEKSPKALLLGMEQNTIPRNVNLHAPIPNSSLSVAVILNSKFTEDCKWAIIGAGCINEELSFNLDPLEFINKLEYSLNSKIEFIASRVTDVFLKKLTYQLDTIDKKDMFDFLYCKQKISGVNAYAFLAEQYNHVPKNKNILFVYNDIESLNIGWLLLYKI